MLLLTTESSENSSQQEEVLSENNRIRISRRKSLQGRETRRRKSDSANRQMFEAFNATWWPRTETEIQADGNIDAKT